jgi:hypothetical protein
LHCPPLTATIPETTRGPRFARFSSFMHVDFTDRLQTAVLSKKFAGIEKLSVQLNPSKSIKKIMNHMNKLKYILTVGTIIACISPLMAQQKRISPHETISKAIDGNRIMIVYGRPYTKDPKTGQTRKIWGELVPYGEVWRTGADEATLLITQKPIVMGETTIPAGAYTLRTLPNEDGTAKLIINKQVGQWGIGPGSYDKDQDLARIDLKKEALDAPVDQFTMAISENPSGGGILKMMWENTAFSTPFTVQK